MTRKRQRRSADFTFRVALAAVKEQQTLSHLASAYEVHPTQIAQWKQHLLNHGSELFGQQRAREQQEQSAREAELFEQIGRLQMEWEWVKKTNPPAGGIPPCEALTQQRCNQPQIDVIKRNGCSIVVIAQRGDSAWYLITQPNKSFNGMRVSRSSVKEP